MLTPLVNSSSAATTKRLDSDRETGYERVTGCGVFMPQGSVALCAARVGLASRPVLSRANPQGWSLRLGMDDLLRPEADAARPGLRYGHCMDAEPPGTRGAHPDGSPGAPWFSRVSAAFRNRFRARRTPDVIDVLIAVGCFAAFSGPVLTGLATGAGPRPAIVTFSVLASAPLIVRRRWPIATLAVLVIVYASSSLLGVQFTPFVSSAGPNLAIAIFTVADRYDRRTSLLAYAVGALATWGALGLGIYLHPGLDQDAVQAGAMIPGWFLGDAVRTRRNYRRALARQSERQLAQTEARIRAEERLRLSRDVHDVVSHSLSMIAVRSGVARLVLDEQPGEARGALAAIETASRSALDEVRQLLRQIREPGQAGLGEGTVARDIADLVRRFAENGLDVTYRATGQLEPGSYGAAVEMSAYRIAQEALTNVTRHAPASSAVLEIRREPHAMTIMVTDDGGAGPDTVGQGESMPGLGIAGMRERALLHNGTFRAGPLPAGGFEVFAFLPSGPLSAEADGAASTDSAA